MKAAFLAFDQCAMWQVALLQMVLHRAGWVWRTVTLDGEAVQTDGGIRLAADGGLDGATPRDFQLVVMAGGEFSEAQINDPRVHRFLRQFDGSRGLIAASCASIQTVGAAGLLGGRRFTCLPHTLEAGTANFGYAVYTGDDVCVDENIISSKGHAHVQWAMAVCRTLGLFESDKRLPDVMQKLAGMTTN
jgi:putative intracellular protease/amidase